MNSERGAVQREAAANALDGFAAELAAHGTGNGTRQAWGRRARILAGKIREDTAEADFEALLRKYFPDAWVQVREDVRIRQDVAP